jgi:hypothetical protein
MLRDTKLSNRVSSWWRTVTVAALLLAGSAVAGLRAGAGPVESLTAVSAAQQPVAGAVVGVDEQPNAAASAAPQDVEVFGSVIDAETEKPVEGFVIQGGHFDSKEPTNVTWGFNESRSTSGRYSAVIKWGSGWTARILADGYVPQPIVSEAPPAGRARIEKVIRLKKGRIVRGRVLDHQGNPVREASVFALRSIGLTLVGGRAVNSWDGGEDKTVRSVKTDADGRFEIAVGDPPAANPVAAGRKPLGGDFGPASRADVPGLAVSSAVLDAWPAPLPAGDAEAVIRLPAPTRVEVVYDIEGSDDDGTIFLQLVMHETDAWKGVEIMRKFPLRNQGRLAISTLPPGRYQFARSRTVRHGNIGQGGFLDRQLVEIASDKPTIISFVRPTGARLAGSVEWEEGVELTGVIINVRRPGEPGEHFPHLFDMRLLKVSTNDRAGDNGTIEGRRGLFLTEKIPPGTYEVFAEGYAPLTPAQERRTGLIGPSLTALAKVTVPESGPVASLRLELKKPTPPTGK